MEHILNKETEIPLGVIEYYSGGAIIQITAVNA
jgi:hypothetical protein